MRSTLLSLVLILCSVSCSTSDPESSRSIESSRAVLEFGTGAVIIPVECGEQVRWLGFEAGASYWEPDAEEISSLEQGLRAGLEQGARNPETLSDYAVGRPDYQEWVRDRVHEVLARLPEYRRQYVGFVTEAGERRILLRGFPGPSFEDTFEFPRWQEEIVVVSDGGSRYWSVVYDVASGTLREFRCNGEA